MQEEKKSPVSVAINIAVVALFIGFLVFLGVAYGGQITELASNPDKFREWLRSFGVLGVFVFMFFQILQVVVAVIPGEFVQVAGGYIYGTLLGTLYSLIGILVGSIIAFTAARLLGSGIVNYFVSASDREKFNFLMNDPKVDMTLFFLFLIPGIPKDVLVYLAGVTPIKPLRFFVIFTVGRFPALLGSSFIGSHIQQESYLPAIIVSIVAGVLFIFGLLFRKDIINFLHRFFHKEGT